MDCGSFGSKPEPVYFLGEGHTDIVVLELSMIGLPGVVEDGMPGRNVQQKPGTARGSPRRSRTSCISRHAVKSRCACERGGWGRLSGDGPGHYNPDPSEGPWWRSQPQWCSNRALQARPACRRRGHEVHEGRMQTGSRPAKAGAAVPKLNNLPAPPDMPISSRTGENPPYGMIGGIEETSASFEARSAPRSYPTASGVGVSSAEN